MTSPFYVQGEQRAGRVRDLFATIARRYDLINDVQSLGLHRRWKDRAVGLARLRAGDRALDVCCGTGDIAFRLARQGAVAIGLDFSEPMLAIAQKRRPKASDPCNPRFICADALHLPFPEGSFDAVTAGYGLRNLACMDAGLAEMCRVARPGGRLVVLDFGRPDSRIWQTTSLAYMRWCLPVIGLALCGSPSAYAYIHQSLRHYPAQQGVAQAMAGLGLSEIHTVNMLGGAMSITWAIKPASV